MFVLYGASFGKLNEANFDCDFPCRKGQRNQNITKKSNIRQNLKKCNNLNEEAPPNFLDGAAVGSRASTAYGLCRDFQQPSSPPSPTEAQPQWPPYGKRTELHPPLALPPPPKPPPPPLKDSANAKLSTRRRAAVTATVVVGTEEEVGEREGKLSLVGSHCSTHHDS